MKIHEYQAKEILRCYGVKTPSGIACLAWMMPFPPLKNRDEAKGSVSNPRIRTSFISYMHPESNGLAKRKRMGQICSVPKSVSPLLTGMLLHCSEQ